MIEELDVIANEVSVDKCPKCGSKKFIARYFVEYEIDKRKKDHMKYPTV